VRLRLVLRRLTAGDPPENALRRNSATMVVGVARRCALLLAAAVVLAACAGSGTSSVSGTATYRERMAMPPEAVLEATIEDVSRADAPSIVIGTTRIESPRVPVAFTIRYDPKRIDPSRRYVVRARIVLNGRPVFITDISHAVLTAGAGDRVAIVMRRIAD
jgi:putative lipoprotein